MGMTPCESINGKLTAYSDIEIDYLNTFFPQKKDKAKEASRILAAFERDEKISEDDKNILKMILHEEKTRWGQQLESDYEMISDEELNNNKTTLLEIRDKKISKLEGEFIPHVLKTMREHKGDSRIRITEGEIFKMTEEGFERAERAIANSEKMEPFKDFSHLKLNPDQKDELKQINEARKNKPDDKIASGTENALLFSRNRFGTRLVKITIDKTAQNGAQIFDDYHKMKNT